jgi:hypothetical protein
MTVTMRRHRALVHVVIALGNGLVTMAVALAVFRRPEIFQALSALELLRVAGRVPTGSAGALALATFTAAVAWSPVLARVLERAGPGRVLATAVGGGIAYAAALAVTTIVLCVPLHVWLGGGTAEAGPWTAVLPLDTAFVSLFSAGLLLSLMVLSPVIVIGGALAGLANAALVRRLLRSPGSAFRSTV